MFVVIGEIGNFYHHKLLADLRKTGDGYHIPRGGWFEKATCPRYFFELLAWLGILLLSRHLFTLLAFVARLGYLKRWQHKNPAAVPPALSGVSGRAQEYDSVLVLMPTPLIILMRQSKTGAFIFTNKLSGG